MSHLSDDGITCLGKVRLHISLKVEKGELVVLLDLEKLGELGVRVNDTSVLSILKTMLDNVSIDLLTHVSSGHLSTRILAQENGKLITDTGGLHEPR